MSVSTSLLTVDTFSPNDDYRNNAIIMSCAIPPNEKVH